jgi:hypothetical protein
MKEDLADIVSETFEPGTTPISMKFVAYGKLREVNQCISDPSLSRRFTDVIGHAIPWQTGGGEQECHEWSRRSCCGAEEDREGIEEKNVRCFSLKRTFNHLNCMYVSLIGNR